MTCYHLTDKHHASIAHFVRQKLGLSAVKFQQLADKLKRCNIESVNYRYDQKKPVRKCKTDNFKTLDTQSYYDAIRCWACQSDGVPFNLDYDIMHAFLFSLVPDDFSPEMSITEWGIYD